MFKKALIILVTAALFSCSSEKNKTNDNNSKTNSGEISVKELIDVNENEILVAVFETSMGEFEVELFARDVPKTVENFAGLASKNYYDGIIFHRVIDDFMIQGGDPTGTGMGGESYWGGKFEDEIAMHLKHDEAGVLSMANAGPNTNGSQFFITLVPTPWLNGRHTVFGKVISGLDVVKAIGKVETSKPGDKPVQDVVMNKVRVEKRDR